MDGGLLLLRIVVGGALIGHGTNLLCAVRAPAAKSLSDLCAAGSGAALTAARTRREHDEHQRVHTRAYPEAAATSEGQHLVGRTRTAPFGIGRDPLGS